MIPRYHLDANVLLRFMRDDDPRQSPAAARLFAAAQAGKAYLHLNAVTVAEIFYVLAFAYRLPKSQAAAHLLEIVQSPVLHLENDGRVQDALQRVIATKVDFGDAYLAAIAAETGDAVASFDRDMNSFADITTYLPS